VICVLENQHIRFLGYGDVESRGWAKGGIADQNAVTETVLECLKEAEGRAQVSIESAVVGIGGPSVRGANARGVVELGRPREVDQRDVNRAGNRASHVQLIEDRMVLQLFPQEFVVDEHPGHRDPRGMIASRLEALVHLLTVSTVEHQSLVTAVNQAHVTVDETVFEPLAACLASVLPEERHEGIALLDIGAQSSGLAVYYGDSLQLATAIPISGDHFTRDLRIVLRVGLEDAEQIKRQFGSAVAGGTPANSYVELPAPTGNREPRVESRVKVNGILQARAQELFDYVLEELKRVGMEHALANGLVLTGGASALPGLLDMAEAMLGTHARKGLAVGLRDWPEGLDDPAWTTTAGLAMYSARLKLHSERRPAGGLLGRILK
jgi:cell division protein FtsA